MRSLPRTGRRLAVAAGTLAVIGLAATSMAASASTSHKSASTTLVVDKSFDIKTTDPQRQFEPTGGIVDHALYDTLLKFVGADVSHPKPDAALSYKASADAKTYTFTLRKNIKFSDGTPLTSKDVVFSFKRLVNLKGNPSFLLAGITTTAKGPYTVVLTSATPNPAIPVLVANTSLGIVNSKVVIANGGSDAPNADKVDKAEKYINAHSVGSGPYTLKSFSTSSQVVLTANPTYWGVKPKFTSVVVRNVLPATQLLDVQRGTNEIALDLSPDQAKTLEQLGEGRRDTLAERVLPVRELRPEGVGDELEPAHPERDPLRDRLQRARLDRRRGCRPGCRRRAVDVPRRAQAGLGRQDRPGQGQVRGGGFGDQQPDDGSRVPDGLQLERARLRCPRAERAERARQGRHHGEPEGQRPHDVARHLPCRHRADGSLVLGP